MASDTAALTLKKLCRNNLSGISSYGLELRAGAQELKIILRGTIYLHGSYS